MNKKVKSLLLITIIYISVILFSISLYSILKIENRVLKVFIANIAATVLIWIFSLMLKNASLYDPYWSVIPPVIILGVMIETNNFNFSLILLFIGILLWSVRLTYNWAKLWSDFSHQDWRYNNIKNYAPSLYPLTSLLAIMIFPTIMVYVQLVGMIELANHSKEVGILSLIGFLVIIVATVIQYISDTQMQNFKKDAANKGKLINIGLWKYSRHPNYFGEILIWWGVYLFYLDILGFNYLIVAPILMTMMFIFVSIPMMEKKILKTRKEYKEYQDKVSMVIPYFHKK